MKLWTQDLIYKVTLLSIFLVCLLELEDDDEDGVLGFLTEIFGCFICATGICESNCWLPLSTTAIQNKKYNIFSSVTSTYLEVYTWHNLVFYIAPKIWHFLSSSMCVQNTLCRSSGTIDLYSSGVIWHNCRPVSFQNGSATLSILNSFVAQRSHWCTWTSVHSVRSTFVKKIRPRLLLKLIITLILLIKTFRLRQNHILDGIWMGNSELISS